MGLAQRYLALRQLWPSEAGFDRPDIEIDRIRINALRRIVAPQALGLAVSFDQGHLIATAGQTQKVERFFIRREEAHAGAVFRRHIGDGRAFRQAQMIESGAEIFDEFLDDAVLA